MTNTPTRMPAPDLSLVVTTLVRGAVEATENVVVWRQLLQLAPQVRDHVAVLGLELVVDESEGYAYLRQKPEDDNERLAAGQVARPRLVRRHQLSFHVSLLLALLRKRLAEADATSTDPRVVLTRDQVTDLVRVFLPTGANEARTVDQVEAAIAKVVELGFLKKLTGEDQTYEVRRILKAFVDAQWLSDFDVRLAEYADQLVQPSSRPSPSGPSGAAGVNGPDEATAGAQE